MSWRVEYADPLAVLRELPDGWAQSCVTTPPRRLLDDRALAVLGEVHRVLREDGTLWLLHTPRVLPAALLKQGWEAHPVPWYTPLAHPRAGLLLLTKQPRYFCETGAVHEYARLRRPACLAGRAEGCEGCPWQADREPHLRLRRLCVLAGSAPVACGACGAPWRRAPQGGARRPGCQHNDPRGRCLILDPFCRSPHTALLTSRYGRSFLGIADPDGGERW